MLKVLFVYDSFSPIGGGSQIALERWLKNSLNFYPNEIDFRLLVSSHSKKWSEEKLKIFKDKVLTAPSLNLQLFYKYFSISYRLNGELINKIKKFNPQIIQLNEPSPLLDIKLIHLAKKNRILISSFYHTNYSLLNFPYKLNSYWQEYIFKKTNLLLCPSEQTKKMWENKLQTPVFRIKYPINQIFFQSQTYLKNKLESFKEKKTLTFIGRLSKEKNIDFAIKLLNILPTNYFLHIVGDGILKEKIKKLVKDLKLEQRVKFWGWLPERRVKEILNKTHFLILPSSFETFGIVYIESLASYTPIITLETSVSKEVIPNETGLLIKTLDALLWKKEILKITQDKYKNFLMNIKKEYKYLQSFEEKNSTQNLIKIYKQALKTVRNKM